MIDSFYEDITAFCSRLGLDFTGEELAVLSSDESFSALQSEAIYSLLKYLDVKKTETVKETLIRLSRLPQKDIKTFDNFDFSVIKGKDVEKLKSLSTLSAIHAHKNIAFIGPAGTGKTHLAQAYGYECCMQGLKTYFIKMSELRDRFMAARKAGREISVLNGLVRPSCLIIDEVGHCEFDKENTRLFFDLIDRRYNKEGSYNIVFTSNKSPSAWRSNFNEDDALLCALDRIFDDATVFTIKGESFRGKRMEKIALQTTKATNLQSAELKK